MSTQMISSDRKNAFLAGLGKAISEAMIVNLYIEKIPSTSSKIKTQVFTLLSQDDRIDAFDVLTNFESEGVKKEDYIDAVLYAGRFLLANKLTNECYLFLAVCQSRVESVYGSPFDYTLYEEIGNMFYLNKNFSEAIKCYERLLELGERSQAVLYFNIGMCYQELNNYSLAIQSCLKSINLDPTFTKAFLSLGQCYHHLNQFDRAIGIFQQLPDCAEAFTCIGNCYYQMKNYEEAIRFYLKSIHLKPEPGVYNNLGAALKKAGFLQDAIFAFNDSLAAENNSEAAGNLITLYVELGKIEEAEKLFFDSRKVLSQQDSKFFQRLIDDKAERMRRASVIVSKAVSIMSKNPSVNLSPDEKSSPPAVNKAANLFLRSVRK
jgi:tetratricopeptide (TPR) repeat protein